MIIWISISQYFNHYYWHELWCDYIKFDHIIFLFSFRAKGILLNQNDESENTICWIGYGRNTKEWRPLKDRWAISCAARLPHLQMLGYLNKNPTFQKS